MDTVLETERLVLRRFTTDDVEPFFVLCSRPEVIRYAQSRPLGSLPEALEYMKSVPFRDYEVHGYGRFACVWKATGAVIGFSGIKYVPEIEDNELGYRFLPEYWGHGLATEAGRASIGFARDTLRLRRLVALIHPDNVASVGVVSKLGFSLERQTTYSGLPGVAIDLYSRAL
ncbi:MAG: GNAT family N-acetyltransferase [Steroidobacteraceae bacterium]